MVWIGRWKFHTYTYGDLEATSERLSSAGIASEIPKIGLFNMVASDGQIFYVVGQGVMSSCSSDEGSSRMVFCNLVLFLPYFTGLRSANHAHTE